MVSWKGKFSHLESTFFSLCSLRMLVKYSDVFFGHNWKTFCFSSLFLSCCASGESCQSDSNSIFVHFSLRLPSLFLCFGSPPLFLKTGSSIFFPPLLAVHLSHVLSSLTPSFPPSLFFLFCSGEREKKAVFFLAASSGRRRRRGGGGMAWTKGLSKGRKLCLFFSTLITIWKWRGLCFN